MPQLPHSCSVESDFHYRCNFNEGFKSQCWLLLEDWPLKLETIVKKSLPSSCCIYLTHLLDLVFFLLCANSSFPPLCPSIPLLWYAFPTELCLGFWTSSVYYSGCYPAKQVAKSKVLCGNVASMNYSSTERVLCNHRLYIKEKYNDLKNIEEVAILIYPMASEVLWYKLGNLTILFFISTLMETIVYKEYIMLYLIWLFPKFVILEKV